jgi:hypothetical protein
MSVQDYSLQLNKITMKRFLILLVFSICISQTTYAIILADTIRKTVTIEKGTTVKVSSMKELSTKKIQEGDKLEFEVYEDITIDNIIVISAGTIVNAYVESLEKASNQGNEGFITIQFSNTNAVDKTKIPLKAIKSTFRGKSRDGETLALAVFVSPLFVLQKGKNVKLSKGKIMNAYVTKDVILNL